MTHPAASAVLWDIDGTLINSGGAVARTFVDAVERVCGVRPEWRGLDLGGRLDPEIAALLVRSAGGSDRHVVLALREFEHLVAERHDMLLPHIEVLPGVRHALTELAGAGVRQTVVTGNLETVGRFKLQSAGLTSWVDSTLGGFGDGGADRAAVAQSALDRLAGAGWNDDLSSCWIVGDTPRDLACARAVGVRCALVATGRYSVAALEALEPDLALTSLADEAAWRRVWIQST